MSNDNKPLNKVVHIDEARLQDHFGEMVRGSVEETLNALLDAEADRMCQAQRYEHNPDRVDTRRAPGMLSWRGRQTCTGIGWHARCGDASARVPGIALD